MKIQTNYYICEPLTGFRLEQKTTRDALSDIKNAGVVIVAHLGTSKEDIIAGLKLALEYAEKDLVDLRPQNPL